MKETTARKNLLKQSKTAKIVPKTNLESSPALSKKAQSKEGFKSFHRYTDLPSLRYAVTPTQSRFYARTAGPLRLSIGQEHTLSKGKVSDGNCLPSAGNDCLTSFSTGNGYDDLNGGSSTVRRVHFAELPPKNNRFSGDFDERKREMGVRGGRGGKEEAENSMKNKMGFCCIDGVGGNSVSSSRHTRHDPQSAAFSNFPFSDTKEPDQFKLGNNGESHGKRTQQVNSSFKELLYRGHGPGKNRKGTQVKAPSHILPAILRSARDGDEDEVAEILKKATLLGMSPDDLNATDGSGRTTLSYIASSGSLKNLKLILKLPKIDVNKADNEGNTPLHFASQAGQVEAINYILSICPNVEIDAKNSLGFTPLMKAALQGRTKCAKLLLFAGASPNLRDFGRGLKAEQWAKFCGRYGCAEVIEKFSRQKLTEKNSSQGKWGSEPELVINNSTKPSQIVPSTTGSNIKLKLRKAFRTTSHPGATDCGESKSFSVISQLTTVALCASGPLLQSTVSPPMKSLMRPLSVPKLEVTLASNATSNELANFPIQHSSSDKSIKEKSMSSILSSGRKKKK